MIGRPHRSSGEVFGRGIPVEHLTLAWNGRRSDHTAEAFETPPIRSVGSVPGVTAGPRRALWS
ncbi:hypothetical protein B005_3710 [Nocardiopsis alba ATCC BAA-2165]|uniref:Uncharacterized protein n=1 Tax=Nocardiopsis alba (strain ATCC BAA-2165 / BE74) TaxID=1205910 RepID=J7KZU9_NOCAA|nr:hypothetical protein B005_3710 [Nocardiopsis alba ATCC BAA-2165]